MQLTVETDERLCVTDITDRVADAVPAEATGLSLVFVEHTTAGVCLQEHERRLVGDIERYLADAVADEGWAHDELDGNADSHLRAMLVGNSVTLPVTDGTLDLGTWQSVLFVECDGPRTRRVTVRVV
ncbi:secondary thiamine-phosphate synthase enzyme [Halogranum gelatinilyticum]|uniref:Secondary thiamine-phosphate synthase enzyme n=1 Tax=Halogranum gelatinilyticum TaxID=660521 RepID=A0A1G9XPZ7_9EURY|nr:secondary thiamine-phosphate synthase enzyme YjbQ [Halogranum gelatinilyticum]SDM98838.1 secondary thiamine-phosphate synthase enzyme [Halogranum gelatinilyticum]